MKNKKKAILFLMEGHPRYITGGAELQAWFLARELVKRGWEVHFTTEIKGNEWDRTWEEEGVWVYSLRRYSLFKVRNVWRLWRVFRRTRPQVVYNRVPKEYTGIGRWFSRLYRAKFLWASSHILECVPFQFTRNEWNNRVERPFWRKLLRLLYAIWVDSWVEWGKRRADAVIFQTDEQRDTFLRWHQPRAWTVIPNGHPVPEEIPEKSYPHEILWLATMKPWKQAEVFLDLAEAYKDRRDVRFVLAGKNFKDDYWHSLEVRLKRMPYVEYIEDVDFERSNQLIGRASVFVNTSMYEGFPNTFIQAWMMATLVLSVYVDPDGIIERQRIGEVAWEPSALKNCLERLLAKRKEIGCKAEKYAKDKYDIQKTSECLHCFMKRAMTNIG